jgi:hypothetical protein
MGIPAVLPFFVGRRARLVFFFLGLIIAFTCAQLSIGREDPIIIYSIVGLGLSLGASLAEAIVLLKRFSKRRKPMRSRASAVSREVDR